MQPASFENSAFVSSHMEVEAAEELVSASRCVLVLLIRSFG